MISAPANYLATIETLPPGAAILLPDVSWEEYEQMLSDFEETPHVRLTYDHGRLEIMTLSSEHEGYAGLFTHLISVLTEELNMPFLARRSTTLKRQKYTRGAEADDCFYFNNLTAIGSKKKLNLDCDPPPDLAIEVDISHGSMSKLPIYAELGVAEIWRFDGNAVEFYQLTEAGYVEMAASQWFLFLTPDVLPQFLWQGNAEDINSMRRAFRAWVQANLP
jgi:Uma2 family endonuclease